MLLTENLLKEMLSLVRQSTEQDIKDMSWQPEFYQEELAYAREKLSNIDAVLDGKDKIELEGTVYSNKHLAGEELLFPNGDKFVLVEDCTITISVD